MGMDKYAPAAVRAAINEAYTVIRRDVEEPMNDISFSFIPYYPLPFSFMKAIAVYNFFHRPVRKFQY